MYSNVTAMPFPDSAAEIRLLLARQLVEPVMWESTLKTMLAAGMNRRKLQV
jgi:[acyl-carrier-protein] S-malonyltransferase